MGKFAKRNKRRMKVIINVKDPTPIAYQDVFEEGDEWIRIKGCEDCPIENKKRCCNQCPVLLKEQGLCMLHMGVGFGLNKPFECIVRPYPNKTSSWCILEYKCVKGGKNVGKIKKLNEPHFHIIDTFSR